MPKRAGILIGAVIGRLLVWMINATGVWLILHLLGRPW